MPSRQSPPPAGQPRRRQGPVMPSGWLWLLLLGMGMFMVWMWEVGSSNPVDYSDLLNLVEAKQLSKVTFVNGDEKIIGELKDNWKLPDSIKNPKELEKKIHNNRFVTYYPGRESDKLIAELREADRALTISVDPNRSGVWSSLLVIILPALILLGVFFLFLLPRLRDPLGGSFLSNYIKSPARRYERNKMRVTFDDVADMESAKGELQEVVDFLRNPDKFQRLGAQVPKGVLLVGPPGTGKTLLARAVAGEAGVPFYSISGSEFIQMFVGVGASRVRDMFKTAKDNAPCLLFIDEIDAVGRMRGAGVGGGSDEREQTLNQILSEMDGFQPNEMVIVLAATNRPDVLDSALLRPGRFDRHVTIDRPTWQGRLAILKVHTRTKPLADDVNLESIAREMIGMTGADLRNLANEAALLATREGRNKIEQSHFERAADRVLIGPKREEVLTQEDKRKTAYHEAGHALVTWLEPGADRPLKVSIIPRGQSLGMNLNVPEEERFHYGMDHFKAKLVSIMGGRAADRLVYGQPYAGAESDLKQATRLARYMVTHWGMSDRLGPMSFRIGEEHVFLGKEIQEPRDFSEGTAQMIDEEVQRLLREADQRAYTHLEQHRTDLDRLAETLLQREELSREDIDRLLRESGIEADGQPTSSAVFAPGSQKI
ncbi:MAG TPA: ATP-dependent zinc metalloprotease FtsH [Gemmataceae bacterium]|nr:ATP-dependent zinc metalloprotease FtsH [Gemmataceae bacterium]